MWERRAGIWHSDGHLLGAVLPCTAHADSLLLPGAPFCTPAPNNPCRLCTGLCPPALAPHCSCHACPRDPADHPRSSCRPVRLPHLPAWPAHLVEIPELPGAEAAAHERSENVEPGNPVVGGLCKGQGWGRHRAGWGLLGKPGMWGVGSRHAHLHLSHVPTSTIHPPPFLPSPFLCGLPLQQPTLTLQSAACPTLPPPGDPALQRCLASPLMSRMRSSFLRMFWSSRWMVCTTCSSRRISVCREQDGQQHM